VWWIAAGLLVLLLLAAGGVIAWGYHVESRSLPQVDGSLVVAGLSSAVTVVRDSQGVPHISAATMEDLLFAQGYVTAQDRLWQMDSTRRFAAGELAEILGRDMVATDRKQRTLGLRLAAENSVAWLSPRDRAYLEAYARGVNAYLESNRGKLPLEFRLLHYSPRPWGPADSFLVGAALTEFLTHDLQRVLAREKIAAKLGPELAADLYPNSSWRDHPPSASSQEEIFAEPDIDENSGEKPSPPRPAPPLVMPRRHRGPRRHAASLDPGPLPFARPETSNAESAWAGESPFPGSNNWVVSGAHTVSGRPLLSNDMHLDHQIPNVWYEAHLQAGDFDVAGVTLPGLPFVIVGHNRRIAWGFTNLGATVEDIYVENFNCQGEYETPEGWIQPQRRREVIHVHGAPDEVLDVVLTRHGPIVTGSVPGESRRLALRWILLSPDGLTLPFFDLDTAQNWNDFRRAAAQFIIPSQNMVYADVDGHIGYQAMGRIPIRASGDASLPVPGNDNSHEWTGYVPFDQLPSIYDPPSGVLATANGRVVPDGYPYMLSNEWGPPYRTERIARVLASGRKLEPKDMLALQTDIYSDLDRFFAERLVYAVDRNRQASTRARQAAEKLRGWDGRITSDSTVPTLVAGARRQLARMLLEPKVGELYQDYRWFMAPVWLENTILLQPPRWLPPAFANYDELLAAAVEEVVKEVAPDDPGRWRWGLQIPLHLQHPVFGAVPLLRHWTGTSVYEQSGNGFTVKQVAGNFGPSERLTVDFSNLDASTLNIVTGQSGNFLSPHYMDQWKAWCDGTTFALAFSPEAVEKSKAHQIMLEPAR
jgi:penicillin amidase